MKYYNLILGILCFAGAIGRLYQGGDYLPLIFLGLAFYSIQGLNKYT